jgi:hypothetical protein
MNKLILSEEQLIVLANMLATSGYLRLVVEDTNLTDTVAVTVGGKSTLVNGRGETFSL